MPPTWKCHKMLSVNLKVTMDENKGKIWIHVNSIPFVMYCTTKFWYIVLKEDQNYYWVLVNHVMPQLTGYT